MNSNYVEKVLNQINDYRQERIRVMAQRENQIRKDFIDLRDLDIRIARAALSKEGIMPDLLKERNSIISQWLKDNSLPEDFLYLAPCCNICNDTGYNMGKLCTCVRNKVAQLMFVDAGLSDNSPSFTNFDLSVFSNTERTSTGLSVRKFMKKVYDSCVDYCNDFPNTSKQNMVFYGESGLGKTYLMDCIAARLISRGFWVVRATSYHVNDIMAKAMFDRADPDSLFDCDLLLLDDLGSEPILNKVTISSLFNLFNERTAQRKPFILSTNLTPEEILRRYGDRVFSRITDTRNTRLLEFEGVDLRKC